jgi:hypothetical protein
MIEETRREVNMRKRMIYGIALGGILGIVCILGASFRMPGELSSVYLLSFWFNRVLMGLVIGLFPRPRQLHVGLVRGLVLGALVSFAFYSATEFLDLMGFMAGLVYGCIIEAALFYSIKK